MILNRCCKSCLFIWPKYSPQRYILPRAAKKQTWITAARRFSDSSSGKKHDTPVTSDDKSGTKNTPTNLSKAGDHISPLLAQKFKVFKEDDSPLILDVEEERRKQLTQPIDPLEEEQEAEDEFAEIDLTHGERGVFDVEQLVSLLECEGAIDLFVAELPVELKYVEHIVIVTGRSARHRLALAQLVRRVYKKKHHKNEPIPRIEGDHEGGTNKDWLAMDLGNIVLHIFARAARERYDLESLWTLGDKFDPQMVESAYDPVAELLAKHGVLLKSLEPSEPSLKDSKTET